MFDTFLLHGNGQPRHVNLGTCFVWTLTGLHLFKSYCPEWVPWKHNILRSDLEREYVTDGHFTFICVIMVVCDKSIPVPASDIGKQFGSLLDSSDGTDVSSELRHSMHTERCLLPVLWFSKPSSLVSLVLWLSPQCRPSPYTTLPQQHSEPCFGLFTQMPSQELTSLGTLLLRWCSIC
jgi:hypothetical protein